MRRPFPLTKSDRQPLVEVLCQFWNRQPTSSTNLEVNFVDAETIGILHRDYLQDASITDVITFDLGHAPDGWRMATLAICVPVAQDYAQRYGVSLKEELQRLVIHGALHLLGYDDRAPADKKKMRRKENEILLAVASRRTTLALNRSAQNNGGGRKQNVLRRRSAA